MTELEQIRSAITQLSGSGKRISSSRRHGIYTTFTLPGLDDMIGVRDTMKRFSDYDIPNDLSGLTVLDVGSNVGAVSFEFARRGASVLGLEYRSDRVELSNQIARHFSLDCEFFQTDFNDQSTSIIPEHHSFDIVWCSSVDEYISNLGLFYSKLRSWTKETLYLESNVQGRDADIFAKIKMEESGLTGVSFVGNGDSGGISRRRKLYVWKNEWNGRFHQHDESQGE